MTRHRLICAAILAASAIVPTATAMARDDAAKPVRLQDAATPPTVLVYIHPGERSREIVCPRDESYPSEFSAYRWNGNALAGQRWNRTRDRTYWRDTRHGGRVAYDGLAFYNGTPRPVIAAAWCD